MAGTSCVMRDGRIVDLPPETSKGRVDTRTEIPLKPCGVLKQNLVRVRIGEDDGERVEISLKPCGALGGWWEVGWGWGGAAVRKLAEEWG